MKINLRITVATLILMGTGLYYAATESLGAGLALFGFGLLIAAWWYVRWSGTFEMGDTAEGEINRKALWGVFFALMWWGGIGSLVAIRNGLAIRRLAAELPGQEDRGAFAALFCLVAGGLGILAWAPILLYGGFF